MVFILIVNRDGKKIIPCYTYKSLTANIPFAVFNKYLRLLTDDSRKFIYDILKVNKRHIIGSPRRLSYDDILDRSDGDTYDRTQILDNYYKDNRTIHLLSNIMIYYSGYFNINLNSQVGDYGRVIYIYGLIDGYNNYKDKSVLDMINCLYISFLDTDLNFIQKFNDKISTLDCMIWTGIPRCLFRYDPIPYGSLLPLFVYGCVYMFYNDCVSLIIEFDGVDNFVKVNLERKLTELKEININNPSVIFCDIMKTIFDCSREDIVNNKTLREGVVELLLERWISYNIRSRQLIVLREGTATIVWNEDYIDILNINVWFILSVIAEICKPRFKNVRDYGELLLRDCIMIKS
jgi:hypothetical protein